MAKRAVKIPSKPEGHPLPRDWRASSAWKVSAMLARISPIDYDATADAFEADARGKVSADWPAVWRAWCRDILVGRRHVVPEPTNLFG